MLKSPQQPINLGVHAGVYDGIEVAVGVFEGKRVRVGEVGGYVDVEFGREGCQIVGCGHFVICAVSLVIM